jgi:hypothetical protein
MKMETSKELDVLTVIIDIMADRPKFMSELGSMWATLNNNCTPKSLSHIKLDYVEAWEVMSLIEAIIGFTECLRYWWIDILGRTNEEYEAWLNKNDKETIQRTLGVGNDGGFTPVITELIQLQTEPVAQGDSIYTPPVKVSPLLAGVNIVELQQEAPQGDSYGRNKTSNGIVKASSR